MTVTDPIIKCYGSHCLNTDYILSFIHEGLNQVDEPFTAALPLRQR